MTVNSENKEGEEGRKKIWRKIQKYVKIGGSIYTSGKKTKSPEMGVHARVFIVHTKKTWPGTKESRRHTKIGGGAGTEKLLDLDQN